MKKERGPSNIVLGLLNMVPLGNKGLSTVKLDDILDLNGLLSWKAHKHFPRKCTKTWTYRRDNVNVSELADLVIALTEKHYCSFDCRSVLVVGYAWLSFRIRWLLGHCL